MHLICFKMLPCNFFVKYTVLSGRNLEGNGHLWEQSVLGCEEGFCFQPQLSAISEAVLGTHSCGDWLGWSSLRCGGSRVASTRGAERGGRKGHHFAFRARQRPLAVAEPHGCAGQSPSDLPGGAFCQLSNRALFGFCYSLSVTSVSWSSHFEPLRMTLKSQPLPSDGKAT